MRSLGAKNGRWKFRLDATVEGDGIRLQDHSVLEYVRGSAQSHDLDLACGRARKIKVDAREPCCIAQRRAEHRHLRVPPSLSEIGYWCLHGFSDLSVVGG